MEVTTAPYRVPKKAYVDAVFWPAWTRTSSIYLLAGIAFFVFGLNRTTGNWMLAAQIIGFGGPIFTFFFYRFLVWMRLRGPVGQHLLNDTFTATFTEKGIAISSNTGNEGKLTWDYVKQITQTADCAILTLRTRGVLVMPLAAFADGDLERVKSMLSLAKK